MMLGMDAWLVSDKGNKYPLSGSCAIGRLTENAVQLEGSQVSRRHAVIHQNSDGRYWLLDFGSANGTTINGQRMRQPVELADQDRVEIAGHFLTFRQVRQVVSGSGGAPTEAAENLKTKQATSGYTATGHGIVVLAANGKIESLSAKAAEWLERYFPEHKSRRDLPSALTGWLAAQAKATLKGKGSTVEAFVMERDSRRLRVSADAEPGGRRLLLMSEEELSFAPAVLESLGLTAREAEVLHWIAEGKSNPEIAIILGIKPRTVTTHVESIFSKLGVNNRSTALLCVVEKLRGG